MAVCSICKRPYKGEKCSYCEPENNSSKAQKTTTELPVTPPEIGSPGSAAEIVFKRYKISERKTIKPYPGFDLYSLKQENAAEEWQPVKEDQELEGRKNAFLTFLFGVENEGYVYYLNNAAMHLDFNWRIQVDQSDYRVSINLTFNIDTPNYFLNQMQGHEQLTVNAVAGQVEEVLKSRLIIEAGRQSETDIDFSQFNNILQCTAFELFESIQCSVASLQVSGQRIESAQEKLKHKISKAYELKKHADNEETEALINSRKNRANVDSVQIDIDDELNEKKYQSELKSVAQQTEIDKEKLFAEKEKDKIKQDRDLQTAQHKTKLSEEEIKRNEQALGSMIKLNKVYEMAKNDIERDRNEPCTAVHDLQIKEESSSTSLQALIPFENIIKIESRSDAVENVHHFGLYFWELLIKRSPKLKQLLTRASLHYVRYEDNYCNDFASMVNLYQILKSLRSFDCYKKFSETQIVFGPGAKVCPNSRLNDFEAPARNRFMTLLLKGYSTHVCVSQKNKMHNRDMCLVFTNDAQVRINFTYGMAFWSLDTDKLPPTITERLQQPVKYTDIDDNLVQSTKALQLPVFTHKTEKDTVLPVWGWLPEVSCPAD